MKRYPLPPFPNGWYKACFTDELEKGEVKRLHLVGRELVLFRGEDGVARVMDAYCVHLGAHLGVGGKVEGMTIRCPFHAWRYDGDSGACVEIPYAKKIPPKAKMRVWPSVEQNGYVAVWHHAEDKPPEYDIPVVPEVGDSEYYLYRRVRWDLQTHLQELYENAFDVKHFVHVHDMDIEKVNWTQDGAHLTLELDLRRAAEEQSDDKDETRFRSYMWGPGLSLTRVFGKMAGVSVQTLTPIDDEKIEVCHNYWVRRSEELPKAEIEAFYDFYASDWELDFNLWNNKCIIDNPLMCDGDGPIHMVRKWYSQFYSERVHTPAG